MSAQDSFDRLFAFLMMFRAEAPSKTKPVFWLGAGCSVADGIPLNDQLLADATKHYPAKWGSLQYRFDTYARELGDGDGRIALLTPYFEKPLTAKSPYLGLATLLRKGYVDLVFTFNIDKLLEDALNSCGLIEGQHYILIKAPELLPLAVKRQLSQDQPRIKIVKLHGDYELGFNLMTSPEIVEFDQTIRDVVHDYSARPAVVCGYSFFHLNVLMAFSRAESSFFYVNRSFPAAPMVLSLMASRSPVNPNFIDAPLGNFENFMARLMTVLP